MVKLQSLTAHKFFRPAMGAVLAVLCGLALWQMPLGDPWVNASYDYLFRFGARSATNKVVLVQIDDPACEKLVQSRANWDRALHARLLDKLTEAGCALVVFDIFFGRDRDAGTDQVLAAAMKRNGRVVLMAQLADPNSPGADIAEVITPNQRFLDAATNWGIGMLDTAPRGTARRHWPFPAPHGNFSSLPWTAALLAGAALPEEPEKQWLRYYANSGGYEKVSYHFALSNSPAFYRDKVVFVGNKPQQDNSDLYELDKFWTPQTRWTKEGVGGVEILITEFLNLVNGDWLRRMSGWLEVLVLLGAGILCGGGLCCGRPLAVLSMAAGAFLLVTFGAVLFSYYTNYWFPWLIVAGGQIPCALTWALASRKLQPVVVPARKKTVVLSPDMFPPVADHPDAPDYEFFGEPFGEGAFGKVWVVRNSIGQHQALKTVYQAKFGHETKPYEMEFKGIKRFKPLSGEHPGLLRVDFVSMRKKEGYFYYVMELGDAAESGWEQNPSAYRPRDLFTASSQSKHGRLSVLECVDIISALAEALGFLHREGFVHRDIKPTNIIFVRGRPKLADVGLVTDIRPADQVTSVAGTEHYMPPPPEMPGTPQADIYALGKVLYVIGTGHHPRQFPELPPGLLDGSAQGEQFMKLNPIILKACQADRTRRYQTADELHQALREVRESVARFH